MSLTAPILVPMMLLLNVSPYFVMALGFVQRYRKNAGVATLASYTVPLAVAMTIAWTLLFLAWWALGSRSARGAPVR